MSKDTPPLPRGTLSRLLGRPVRPFRVPVVYTMGKVASTAILDAIQAEGLRCYHIHTLDRRRLKKLAGEWLSRDRLPLPHICEAMAHRNGLFSEPDRCLFISLVRDPLARNLAAFFENLHRQPPGIRDETDPARLFALCLETVSMEQPLHWFDREYKAQLGIDIYDLPFDPARRQASRDGLILMRTDCPDVDKSRTLSAALGRRVRVGRANDSAAKAYADRYRQVRALARFPPDLVDRIYDSRFARHFWTEAERQAMAARWRDGVDDLPDASR